jgi:hypothetical protein
MNLTPAVAGLPVSAAPENYNDMTMNPTSFTQMQCISQRKTWLRLLACSMPILLGGCAAIQQTIDKPEATAQSAAAIAPSPDDIMSLRRVASLQDRLDQVAGPLLISNPDLCKRHVRNLLGLSAKNKYSFSVPLADAAQHDLGLGDRLQVTNVMPGSGAARLGIQRGDILLAAQDKPIPQGPNAENETAALLAPIVAKGTNVKLTVQRNEKTQDMTIPLTRSCGFRVELGNADNVNSYSDGRRILITKGMVLFAQTDEELAYVIAKEMAHNVLGHARMLKMTGKVGKIIDRLTKTGPNAGTLTGKAGIKPMPQQYDITADALSLQMVARSGFSIDRAIPFWKRLAMQYPAAVLDAHTALHPSTTARLSAMPKSVKRINAIESKKSSAPSS